MGHVPMVGTLAVQAVEAQPGSYEADGVITLELVAKSNNPDGFSVILVANTETAYRVTFEGQPVNFINNRIQLSTGNGRTFASLP